MGAPDRTRPRRIVRAPGHEMHVQLGHLVSKLRHVQPGRPRFFPEHVGTEADLVPEPELVGDREIEDLLHLRDPGDEDHPRVTRLVHEPKGREPELDHGEGVGLESGVEAEDGGVRGCGARGRRWGAWGIHAPKVGTPASLVQHLLSGPLVSTVRRAPLRPDALRVRIPRMFSSRRSSSPSAPAPVVERIAARDRVALAISRWPEPGTENPVVRDSAALDSQVTDAPRGVALLVHGLGEHGGRHAHLARRLLQLGWRVLAYDHRGHGQSGGPRGVIPSDEALLDDLEEVLDHLAPADEGLPLLLFGHSMGGVVAARFVAEGRRPVDRLVLSSPALDPGLGSAQRLLIRMARRLAPDLALANGLDPAGISRDPAVVEAYRNDPRVHDRITPRLAGFVMESGPKVLAAAPTWSVPTLVLWAGDDVFVGPEGSAAFVRAAPGGVVEGQVFPALRHEILNEPEREEVLAVLEAWLEGPPHEQRLRGNGGGATVRADSPQEDEGSDETGVPMPKEGPGAAP